MENQIPAGHEQKPWVNGYIYAASGRRAAASVAVLLLSEIWRNTRWHLSLRLVGNVVEQILF